MDMTILLFASLLAGQEAPVDEVLRRSPSGLCVLVGVPDGALAAKAAEGGRWVVHALDADEANVRSVRQPLNFSLSAIQPRSRPWIGRRRASEMCPLLPR